MFIVPLAPVRSGAARRARRSRRIVRSPCVCQFQCKYRRSSSVSANVSPRSNLLALPRGVFALPSDRQPGPRALDTRARMYSRSLTPANVSPPPSVNLFSRRCLYGPRARNGASFWRVAVAFRDVRGIFTRSGATRICESNPGSPLQ